MIVEHKVYKIYRINENGTDEYGDIVKNKELLFDNVLGGNTYSNSEDVDQGKFSNYKIISRVVIKGTPLNEYNVNEVLYLQDIENNFWKIVKILPYRNFFDRTMLFLEFVGSDLGGG